MQPRPSSPTGVRNSSHTPHTPTRGGHHGEINSIVEKLEEEWELGLQTRSSSYSPSTSQEPRPQHRCYEVIKLLYWKDRAILYKQLHEFKTNAASKPHRHLLSYLLHLVDEGWKRAKANPTPLRSRREQLTSPHPPVPSPLRLASPTSRPEPSSIFNPGHSRTEPQVSSDAASEVDALFEPTQPDTPPAEEDEEPGDAPPSPSLQASVRKKELSGPGEHDSRHMRPAKRLSPSSKGDQSPKKARTTTRGNHEPEASFAVPNSPLARERQTEEPSRKDSTTSFASTASKFSRADSTFSRNGEASKTRDTSFATSFYPSQPGKQQLSQPAEHDIPQPEDERSFQVEPAQQEISSSGNYSHDTDIPWYWSPRPKDESKDVADQTTAEVAHESTESARFRPGEPLERLIELSTHDSVASSANLVSSPQPQEHYLTKRLPEQGLFVPQIGAELMKMDFKYRWEFLRVALEAGIDTNQLLPQGHDEEWKTYQCLWDYFQHHDALKDTFKKLRRGSKRAWDAAEVKRENGTLKAFENITLKAQLAFSSTKSDQMFNIRLQPLELQDASCRFQRAFGGDRFLYLETPEFRRDKLPPHLSGQLDTIEKRFVEWLLLKNKEFLGREWVAIHFEKLEKKNKTKSRPQDEGRGYRVILFATKGADIESKKEKEIRSGTRHEMSAYDLLNWFMPLRKNAEQPYLKAFARISLGLTTTRPGLTFEPKQVRFVQDIKANNERESSEFNDETLSWPEDDKRKRVMNDGCSRISVGAARQLWKNINKDGPIPSTFQGRIGGAKGMWMLSASPDTQDPSHCSVWIEVSDSQCKFQPHDNDSDPVRFTFDLHSTSTTAEPSSVYLSFFPILHDRGVPTASLQKVFVDNLDRERKRLLDAIGDPGNLRTWVNQQNMFAEERAREDEIAWQGGLPKQPHEKVILLVESGFDSSCEYLANVMQRLVARSLRLLRQNVRVPLPRCTYIKGVADPEGILAPGEIHVHFTKSFIDEASGECLSFLDNRDVLVARNPALRRSDIQKVRTCFKLELAHLKDVVVFPTRGSFPLAGKLQGGDYDGDTFWVCWEPDLVTPFKNAPPPLNDPVPEDYGIKVDRRTLGDMLEGRSIRNSFLRESFKFHFLPSLVGPATKLYEKVTYQENSLVSKKAEALADLHDLLIDATKNGYKFGEAEFRAFRAKFNIPKDLPKPEHEKAREQDRDETKGDTNRKAKRKPPRPPPSYPNILDTLYFDTIVPHTRQTLDALEQHFATAATDDDDPTLTAPFLCEKHDAAATNDDDDDPAPAPTLDDNAIIRDELAALTGECQQLNRLWTKLLNQPSDAGVGDDGNGTRTRSGSSRSGSFLRRTGTGVPADPQAAAALAADDARNDPASYNNAVAKCHARFRAYRPRFAAKSPTISRWERRRWPGAPHHHHFPPHQPGGSAEASAKAWASATDKTLPPPPPPSEWDLLRASALYLCTAERARNRYNYGDGDPHNRWATFVFHVAGWELCWLKALGEAAVGTRPVVGALYNHLRPGKMKAVAAPAKDGGGGEGGAGAGDGEGEGGETDYASAAEEIEEGDYDDVE
ncbi:rna-directed rna polymerase 2 [Diplodia corticola]|uniref:Rna-directed rna polymerase 2 n=1 Tax=Diplodia corticola TaxID=236234 RepID=A0A1J9RNY6_9PEZI|nr:rna-directed rna polymerase 2 [Diplodia corticola]OJD30191.1 rna-directed rna polymerase 2 [Diplodia corticola]